MDFEVTWEPGEAERFWFWDQSHWPHPTTPLAATLELPAMAEGFTRAAHALSRPLGGYFVKVVHGFVYFGFDLAVEPAVRAARAAAQRAALAARVPDVMRFWTDEVLPEVQAGNDRMRFTDWGACSEAELASALDELYALRVRHWELHDLVLVPAMAALDRFLGLYARLFPDAPPEEAHALLRALPNKTVETARALWRLAHDEQVARFVQGADLPPRPPLKPAGPLLSPAIGGAQPRPGRALRGKGEYGVAHELGQGLPFPERGEAPPALRAYLDEYGWRTDGWELSDPALRERPGPVLARLRAYLSGGHPDPETELRRAAEERGRLTAAALARLGSDAARAEFQGALDGAFTYPVLSEDHNFYIDQMGMTALRVPLLAMGRRLADRDVLERAEDVFYLTREELRALLHSAAPASSVADHVTARRADRTRRWGQRPPATIGAPLPAEMADDPLLAGFFGLGAEPPAGARVLRGTPGAPGVAAGLARVARTIDEADELVPGEVLVCPMTSPAWTPLFATAAAVVADAGGALSHTAIVAREYGIPCVVAVKIACREIRTGEWIEVDGTAGEVRRVDA